MSYEMKNILKIMIDNNEPHWSADTMDMARKELDRVYAQASKADEYEAKAKAFDELRYIMDYHYPDKEDREGVRGYQHPKVALKNIGDVIEEYESGESEC